MARPRNDGIDLLRGLAMVLMALDHTRDFFGDAARHPTDLATTTVPLFLTRWVTHFCAPVFVLLAGTAAALYGARGRTTAEVSRFLVTRGLWLVVLEVTLVRLGWMFDLTYRFTMLQVIWAIGWSMVFLGGLVFLPRWTIALVGGATVALHDALDRTHFHTWLWAVVHEQRMLHLAPHVDVFVVYPLVPWVGVMALGYAMGPWFLLEPSPRRQRLLGTGAALCAAFVALRLSNHYGDPAAWVPQRSVTFTTLAVLNCAKYPPSLDYLLMTLGPALVVLALVDGRAPAAARPLLVFGRVPMFYYLLHLPLIHVLAGAALAARGGLAAVRDAVHSPHGSGFSLPVVYLAWLCAVVILYPACAWFAGVKQRSTRWWLSYL